MLKVRCSVSLAAILRDANPYYQAEGEWHNAVDILLEAISKDRERVEKMNERLEKVRFLIWVLPYGGSADCILQVLAAEHPIEEEKLVTVTIKSSVAGISETTSSLPS